MPFRIIFLLLAMSCAQIIQAADTVLIRPVSPLPVEKQLWTKSLSGSWLFNPAPETGFERQTFWSSNWKKIEVPGEWVMQGFKVAKHAWAGYASKWTIPASWAGKRIKLRSDGIYSEAEVFVNGKPAITHIGGFTPFETDITELLANGRELTLTIKVKNEGWADSTSAGSSYAVHALGGITRKIQLIALPDVNIGAFQFQTFFDRQYQNAILSTQITVKNESLKAAKAVVLFELLHPQTKRIVFSKQIELDRSTVSGKALDNNWQFNISRPLKWDSEHPNLYTYRATLLVNGIAAEVTERKVGFRQIEVRKNRVYVNNMPVKLRGVCHHEVMPLRGRSTTIAQTIADVKLFAAGNVNYLRTSHYPPPQELVEACDSIGMFVEVEAPFCWAERGAVPAEFYKPILQDQTLDMVDFFRSNPSVLIWSIGNESKKWDEYFKRTAALVKKLDPHRPRNFSQYEPDGDKGEMEIGNHHYPGPEGPDKYKAATRPIVFDEYTHLNAYNRFELVTDPGLLDAWGIGLVTMWEKMYATPAILGGALWAGIDDTFILPDSTAVGFGTWGVVDGWRRPKPEFWHMKKAYSPIRLALTGNWNNGSVKLIAENRHLFTNLNECKIKWKLAADSGIVSPDIAVGKKDTLKITCKQPGAGALLSLTVWDSRGLMIDEYLFNDIVPKVSAFKPAPVAKANWRYEIKNGSITAIAGEKIIVLDRKSGSLQVRLNQKQVMDGLAELMILPLNPEGDGIQMRGSRRSFVPYNPVVSNRVIKKVVYQTQPNAFKVHIWDDCAEATGFTEYTFLPDGSVTLSYRYQILKNVNPRQWGMVFRFSAEFMHLNWERNGLWNVYPENHIGRLNGSAIAINTQAFSGPAGPIRRPLAPWYHDQNGLGTNDFRSTKMNITKVTLSGSGHMIILTSDGTQSTRTWRNADKTIGLLIARYSNLGAEKFFNSDAKRFEKPLLVGDVIEDKVTLWVK